MPRQAVAITATPEETGQLEALARERQKSSTRAIRAQVVLMALAGKTNEEIAEELQVSMVTVRRWRSRFAKQGMAGLRDRPRPGKPRVYQEDFRKKVLETLQLPPPEGQSSWDGASLAAHLNASPDAVWRLLRKEGISLQRQRSWYVSTELDFAPKLGDFLGLYLNPPLNAVLIGTDERLAAPKNARAGFIQTDSGKVVEGFQSAHKQLGHFHLQGALEVAGRGLHAATTAQKRREDFHAYLGELVSELSSSEQVDIVMTDSDSEKDHEEWTTQYGEQVRFHFIPSSSSWLAVVEIFCSLFSPLTLDAEFANTSKLRTLIEEFLLTQNARAKPFKWQKREAKGSKLANKVINLCN